MKGFFKWFKPGAKMKRWLFLVLVGVVLACYGISTLLVEKELDFEKLIKIIASFVTGFTCIVLGMVYMQKRTLELFVQETDMRKTSKNLDAGVNALIFDKKIYNEGPKIVVIGGGSGLNSVLKGLKYYTSNITAIVPITDLENKKSSSREILEMLPMEEIKNSLVALSSEEEKMDQVLNHKFQEGKLEKITFGDIFIKTMLDLHGNFAQAIEEVRKVLNITGRVIPVTLEEIKVCAELEDGTIVKDKNKITDVVDDRISKINRVFISPSNCRPAPGVLEAIREADAIVIGPGSLYKSIIPGLLVNGVSRAIKENTKAFKIYVSNIMTEPGQTDDYGIYDHIKAIIEHSGGGKGIINYCIYDTGEIVPEYVRKYNLKGSEVVEKDVQKVKNEGIYLVQRDLVKIENDYIRHNPDAIATTIIELICDDLKFRDMHNDSQFMILNTKYKAKSRELKKLDRYFMQDKSKYRKKNKKKSKFYNKYPNRIDLIKESNSKINQKDLKIKQRKSDTINKEIDKSKNLQVRKTTTKNVSQEDVISKMKEQRRRELLKQAEEEKRNLQEDVVKIKKEKEKVNSTEVKNVTRRSRTGSTTKTGQENKKVTKRKTSKEEEMTPEEIERQKFLDTINKLRR